MSPADSVVYLHKKTISPKTVSKNGRDTMTMPELLEPAQNLNDVHKTLSPKPLVSNEQLAAFYIAELNAVRGGDKYNVSS